MVDVPGALTLDHPGLMVEAAADGLGIAYVNERAAQAHLADGRLRPVLADWRPAIPACSCTIQVTGRCRVPCAPSSTSSERPCHDYGHPASRLRATCCTVRSPPSWPPKTYDL